MRLQPSYIIAIGAILLGSSGLAVASQPAAAGTVRLASQEQAVTVEQPAPVNEAADFDLAESYEDFVGQDAFYGAPYLAIQPVPYSPSTAVRFGWWAVDVDGSKANVGEWQGLDSSSPFWDVDGIRSNGYQTIDFYATGTENETTQGGLHLYTGPGLTFDAQYDRFLHRLGHKPLGGPPLTPFDPANPLTTGFPPEGGFYDPPLMTPQPGFPMWGEDLNRDAEYALRVQQLKASFQGNLTNNLKWRLNMWGLRKEGLRQVNATQHCFQKGRLPDGTFPPNSGQPAGAPGVAGTCHVLSQSQRVDWLTMEIEPVIEARFGWLTAEYSRTMRTFRQDDQIVTRDFDRGTAAYSLGTNADFGAYAYVPENTTEIDRLKLRGELAPNTDLYVVGHVGNTHNEFRESDRKFYGVDARLTNTSFEGLSMTAYGKTNSQRNSEDTISLNTRYPDQATLWLENNPQGVAQPPQTIYGSDAHYYQNLVDRDYLAAGVKGRWRPFYDACDWRSGTAFTGGYEWSQLERDNVTYRLRFLNPEVLFTQPTTVTNMFFVGLQQDWSYTLNTFVRYRWIDRKWPLVGVTHRQQLDLDSAINSNQPQHEDRIELGGTWQPVDNFMLNASFWLVNSYHKSDLVDFDEDSYPIVISAWYGMSPQWSFTGGFATFSNWITQDITLGREDGRTAAGAPALNEAPAWTSPWDFAGRADVFNVGAAYAVTCDLTLVGGFEYVRSRNVFALTELVPPPESQATNPPIAAVPYTDLPGYSAVRVNTTRLSAGTDYRLTNNMNTFFRYNLYDFDNEGWNYASGTAHMFLVGLSGVY